MNKSIVLEMCVETLAAALAAERSGADRIELCEDLRAGGVTPRPELMRAVREQLKIPVFAMIRPRSGDFFYSGAEFEQMKREIDAAKAASMNGVALGMLRGDGTVDVQRTTELVQFAQPLPVTFHRAFDEVPALTAALEDVIATGAARILTSGGALTAEAGATNLAELMQRAGERITILVGGGLHPENIAAVAQATRADEFHSGLSSTLPYPRTEHMNFAAEVRRLAEALRSKPRPTMTTTRAEKERV
jgi:copper homeostasis protein